MNYLKRQIIKHIYGVRLHEIDDPRWMSAYEWFISKYTNIWNPSASHPMLRVEFVRNIPAKGFPGDEEGVTNFPWLITLSLRVRLCLYQNVFLDEGLYILFRQIAYVEFWQKDIFFWYFKWLWNKRVWRSKADERAKFLLMAWETVNKSVYIKEK